MDSMRRLAAAVLCLGGLLLGSTVLAGASSPDKDDMLRPANRAEAFYGIVVVQGPVGSSFVTVACQVKFSAKVGPSLAFAVPTPSFFGCVTNTPGSTLTTNSTNDEWKAAFVDAAHDETTVEPNSDTLKITVPKAGLVIMTGANCVITIPAGGPGVVPGVYKDAKKGGGGGSFTFNTSLPAMGSSACPTPVNTFYLTARPGGPGYPFSIKPGFYDLS